MDPPPKKDPKVGSVVKLSKKKFLKIFFEKFFLLRFTKFYQVLPSSGTKFYQIPPKVRKGVVAMLGQARGRTPGGGVRQSCNPRAQNLSSHIPIAETVESVGSNPLDLGPW